MRILIALALSWVVVPLITTPDLHGEPLKCGIIGCDTSHVVAFTQLINDPQATDARAEVEVRYAYAGGSDDIASSYERVPKFTAQLKEMGIEFVDSIEELVEKSDAILLESVDGRKHLEQFRRAAVGKPVFIDKPIAASLADAMRIFRIAEETNTPCFSSSGLRFCEQVTDLRQDDDTLGELLGAATSSPYHIEPHHPDLFWYGIHGIEALYTLMGPGCVEVTRVESDVAGVVVGKWQDGRLGTFRGIKTGHAEYTFVAYGRNSVAMREGFSGYGPLVNVICEFLLSKKPPVTQNETIEILAFMEAADQSKAAGGTPVSINTIIERAEEQVRLSP